MEWKYISDAQEARAGGEYPVILFQLASLTYRSQQLPQYRIEIIF